jgi:hypothetical protein
MLSVGFFGALRALRPANPDKSRLIHRRQHATSRGEIIEGGKLSSTAGDCAR